MKRNITKIFTLIAFTVISLTAVAYLQSEIINSVRAYVRGEGLYAKGQKDAVLNLYQFIQTKNPKHFRRFEKDIQLPIGDRLAREALQLPEPDYVAAYDGFLQGGNHPSDIPGMIRLFLYFGKISYFKKAIKFWEEGDEFVGLIHQSGKQLKQAIATADQKRIEILLAKLEHYSGEVNELEYQFSKVFGDASRWIKALLNTVSLSISFLILLFVSYTALRLTRDIEKTEQKLIDEQTRLSTILRTSSDGNHIVNTEGILVDANDAFFQMLGFDRSEIGKLKITDWDVMFDEESVKASIREIVTSGKNKLISTSHRRKNGELIDVELNICPMIIGGQALVYASSRDITERKRAQEELQTSQQLLHKIVENIPNMVFLKRASDLRFELFNRAGESLLGMTRNQLIGRNDYDFFPEEQADFFTAMDRKVLEQPGVVDIPEEPIETPHGKRILHTRKVALHNEQGETIYLLGISEDITSALENKAALQAERDLSDALIDTTQAIVLLLDTEGQIVRFNAYMEELCGYRLDEVKGRSWVDTFLQESEREHIRKLFSSTLKGTPTRGYVNTLLTRSGEERLIEWYDKPLTGSEGKVVGLLATGQDITEKRCAEQSLREREEVMSAIVGQAADAIELMDLETFRFVEFNDASFTMLGYTREEYAQLTVFDIQAGLSEPHVRALATDIPLHETKSFENQHRCKDGSVIDVQVSVRAIKLRGHRYMVAIWRDITEQKRSEKVIKEFGQRYQAVMDTTNDGLCLVDMESNILEVNDVYCRLSGYTREELIGMKVSQLDIVDNPEAIQHRLETMMKEGGIIFQTQHRRKDGSTWPVEVSVSYSPIKGGRFFSFMRDITEQKRDADELEQYHQHLEQLVEERTAEVKEANRQLFDTHFAMDQAGIGIHWVDVNTGRVLYVNSHAARMLGYSVDEMLELSIPEIDPNFPSSNFKNNTDVMFANGLAHFESQQKKKDGSLIPVDVTGYLLKAKDDKPDRFITFISDITDRKKAEEELLTAKAAAEQANRAKSIFLANMSHEIRTPMNGIIGMSNLALQMNVDEKTRDYITKVNHSAESLLGILNDILDFSKIEAGKLEMEIVNFYLDEVLEALNNLVGLKAEEKGLELMFDIPRDVPRALVGDPLRLGQILANLCNNAVKFTDPGGEVVVTTALVEYGKEQTQLQFSVRDSGIGMSDEEKNKLFRPFSQTDSSTTRRYGGTGLGLVICKELTELMGGRIWIESEPGKGSTFSFTAFFGIQEKQPEAIPLNESELQSLRVLIVDDNTTSREILTQQLQSFHFHVDQADSGPSAIEILKKNDKRAPFDLVLMDWRMPELDGIETIRIIQKSNEIEHIPTIIMISAFNRLQIERAVKDLRLAGFLEKPVTPSALHNAILVAFGYEAIKSKRQKYTSQEVADALIKLHGSKVLLVEDNDINQELVLELLMNNGIEVKCAFNGQEAIELVGKNRYDGVLMDCQMPVMDGYTSTREIRKHEEFETLPIIAMTAHAMVGDRQMALDAGMNDYVTKPLNVDNMFMVMAKWISPADPGKKENIHSVDADREIDLPALPGIDTQAGLRVTQNNVKLYRKLLKKFLNKQANFAKTFKDAQNNNDLEAAANTVHTLKGVAGNLGMTDVYSAARSLESAMKRGDDHVDELLEQVVTSLNFVLAGLRQFDETSAEKIVLTDKSVDPGKVEPLLAELSTHLSNCSTMSRDIVQELVPLLQGSPFASQLERIVQSIEDYNFQQAEDDLEIFTDMLLLSNK